MGGIVVGSVERAAGARLAQRAVAVLGVIDGPLIARANGA